MYILAASSFHSVSTGHLFPPRTKERHTHTHTHTHTHVTLYGYDIASSRVLFSLNRRSLVKQASRFCLHVSGHTPAELSEGRTPRRHTAKDGPISLATLLNTCTRPSVQLITDPWVIGAMVPGDRSAPGNIDVCACTGHSMKVPSHRASCRPSRHPVKRAFRTKVAAATAGELHRRRYTDGQEDLRLQAVFEEVNRIT